MPLRRESRAEELFLLSFLDDAVAAKDAAGDGFHVGLN
jgi:hypothetical protein